MWVKGKNPLSHTGAGSSIGKPRVMMPVRESVDPHYVEPSLWFRPLQLSPVFLCVLQKMKMIFVLCVDGQQHEWDMTKRWSWVTTGLKLWRIKAHRHSCLSPGVCCFWGGGFFVPTSEWMNKIWRGLFGVCSLTVWWFHSGKVHVCGVALCFEIKGRWRGTRARKLTGSHTNICTLHSYMKLMRLVPRLA